ncbi:MAG: HIRAN domain-containing protein [Nitrospirae bacterium]|nr:HIRAN domain-containing protein [Nitrospirota bacterium]
MLGRSGGIRETDSMEVFLCPQKDKDGKYHVSFFSRGIRYLPKHALEVINSLNPNDQLFIMSDLQNPSDEFAIALRTGEPVTIVGYCPSYLAEDFHSLLKECGPNSLKITVERVNSDAPTQLRLLCSMIAPWPNNFEPCDGELFEVLPERVL